MHSRGWLLATGMMTVLLTSCIAAHPTEVTTLWRDPSAPSAKFSRMLAIYSGDDAALRRRIEGRVAAVLPNATSSYRLIGDAQLPDTACVRDALAQGGFDGVIVMRLVGVEQRSGRETRPLTPASESLWEYLRRTPRAAFRTGRETAITMETHLYSAQDGRLVWVSRSTSFNPLSTGDFVGTFVDASIDAGRKLRLY